MSDRVESVGRMESEDIKVVSEILGEIGAVIIDFKVSSKAQIGPAI